MEKEYLYLVYLLKCSLNKEKANTTNLSYYDVFDIACKHSIAAMTFESVKDNLDASLYRKWEEVKNKAIAKDIYQRAELIKLTKLFEDENIRCMPLKGTIMKNYYPYTYFREMADLDICIDSCNREKVKMLEIEQFEKNINQLSLVWFECEMYNQYVKSFEKSILDSGTYGSKEVYVNNIYKRNLEVLHNSLLAKIKLYWSRIFPKILNMRENFPILEKFIILLPFCYVYRILNAILNKRNVIKKEIKLIKNVK